MQFSQDSPVLLPRTTGAFRAALMASLVAHLLCMWLWDGAPPSGTPGGGVLKVTLLIGGSPMAGSTAEQVSANTAAQSSSPADASAPANKPSPAVDTAPALDRQTVQPAQVLPPTERSYPLVGIGLKARSETGNDRSRARVEEPGVKARAEPVGTFSKQPASSVQLSGNHAAVLGVSVGVTVAVDSEEKRESDSPGASEVPAERAGTGGDASDRIRSALQAALLTRFDYPMLARRRGWEGRVSVALMVEPDGDLTNLRIVESSGFKVLDRAAIKDLREVGKLPSVGPWLGEQEMRVVLPVQYRLSEH